MSIRPRFLFWPAVVPALVLALAFGAVGPALAGASKQSAVSVRFYAEGGAEGGEFSQKIQLLTSKRDTFMQSMPLLTEREIRSFYPFQARDGSGTFGASFRLDSHGAYLLTGHTSSRRGSFIFAYFNGRHVVDLYVDRAVTDGIITIPSGLTPHDISLLEVAFPMMGHEGEKPLKKEKPSKKAPEKPLTADDMPRLQPAMKRQADGTLAPARATGAAPSGDAVPRPLSPIGQ